MKKLLSTIEVSSVNGIYRFYQYRDENPLPQIELYKVSGEKEIAIQNVYGEVKKLNDEFKFQIEYAPKNRKSPLNTRELSDKFIKEYKDILQDFNGEISHFKPFSNQIIKILYNQFKNFKSIPFAEY